MVMACRNAEKARLALAEILHAHAQGEPKLSLEVMELDLADLDSIRSFSQGFLARHSHLDVLVNNAGLNAMSEKTKQGFEGVFGTNFLGHFLLTQLLYPSLVATKGSRVVNLSSVMHHYGSCRFEEAARGHYTGMGGLTCNFYSDSKLAAILHSVELRRRMLKDGCEGPCSIAVNPGAVSSEIWRYFFPGLMGTIFKAISSPFFLIPEQGCHTSLAAAVLPPETLQSRAGGEKTGNLYLQPYQLPFGRSRPFELMGPFVGWRPQTPSLPADYEDQARRMWEIFDAMLAKG